MRLAAAGSLRCGVVIHPVEGMAMTFGITRMGVMFPFILLLAIAV